MAGFDDETVELGVTENEEAIVRDGRR